jgi:hypothetical protein
VHQHGLGLVIGVVADGDGRCAHRFGHFGQKAIARLTRRLLQGAAGVFGQCDHVGAADHAWQAPVGRQAGHEIRIRGRLGPAQAVIEVRHVQTQVQLRRQAAEQVEQAHRVWPARNADDNRVPARQQAVTSHVSEHLPLKIVHRERMIARDG